MYAVLAGLKTIYWAWINNNMRLQAIPDVYDPLSKNMFTHIIEKLLTNFQVFPLVTE